LKIKTENGKLIMHIKLYFNDKPLFLTDSVTPDIEAYVHHDDAVYIDEFSSPGIKSMIHEMKEEKVHAGIFVHQDLEALKKAFFKKFQIIRAAGGLVINESGKLLFIFRRGKWDLPKGKLDARESPESAGVREVEEETGLKNVSIKNHLVTTFHTYDESGHHILKETEWYLMNAAGEQQLVPQTEEQITAIEWADAGNLKKYLSNTYHAIEDVLRAGGYI
jgi:8-oxo-dGTP pyrophosphatase MutT (NUDIX family)